jgi:hypothetical protein
VTALFRILSLTSFLITIFLDQSIGNSFAGKAVVLCTFTASIALWIASNESKTK